MPEKIKSTLSLAQIQELEEKLHIQKAISLEKALQSRNVEQIYAAKQYLRGIEKREETSQYAKGILVDPLDVNKSMGYKEKFFSMSYDVLRAMASTPIINAIIKTRKSQVAAFTTPQEDKYSTGFIIRKKNYGNYDSGKKTKSMSRQERQIADDLVEYLLNCGTVENQWHGDDFETFATKYIDDSLTLDQGAFHIIRNPRGEILEFYAMDGGTMRLADTFDEDMYSNPYARRQAVQGYLPSTVQVWNGQIVDEFYPWELCMGIRNAKTDIRKNGYGESELEKMIQTVTALLNMDFYNANFFKVGSAPKGIIKVHGQVNQAKIDEFRTQWSNQVAGVMNMHKIPIMHAEKAEFMDLTKSNRDMEFGKYNDLLIKTACSIFLISPEEVGFEMGKGAEGRGGLGNNSNETNLKYSRDKGLKPLVRHFAKQVNKYLIDTQHKGFEYVPVGLETKDQKEELDFDVTSVTNIETLNEVRARRGLKPLEGGDIPLNPVYLQAMNISMQGNQQSNMAAQGMQNGGAADGWEEDDGNDNPFMKSLSEEVNKCFAVERIVVP